ncbi:PHP domain-containing protein [candidate division KSB1 bacterium]|nr:PHP domain-containing protein [candidate division KSB1 bacterium]
MTSSAYGIIHCHTPFSDGDITPEIIRASQLPFAFIAVTDHDTLAGYTALKSLEQEGIAIIPGIELTVFFLKIKFHVLVLEPATNAVFHEKLQQLQAQRKNRVTRICQTLKNDGWFVPDKLDSKRNIPTKREIFSTVFNSRQNQHRLQALKLQDARQLRIHIEKTNSFGIIGLPALDILSHIDGIKILAHPAYSVPLAQNYTVISNLIEEFKIPAMEIITRKHRESDLEGLRALANRLNVMGITSNDVHESQHLFSNQTPVWQLTALHKNKPFRSKAGSDPRG